VTVGGHGSWWLSRIILLPELAAGLGCFWVARRKIAVVKNADDWFAGLRQTVVAGTSWRTDPPRFPVRWLIPALAVMAATVAVGALRYPALPAGIVNGSGHRVPKSVASALIVAGQLYFTAVCSGLMLLVHRSRPDIEAADPVASMLCYRRFLAAFTRVLLTLAALVDTVLLLLAAVAARAGQGGSRLNGNVRGLALPGGTDRDDDRFWKAVRVDHGGLSGAVRDAAGRPASDIVALGPPLRGRWYETTAIPEIRDQAAALARHLVTRLRRAQPGSAA
jgi:uncharacterized membrane protein